MSVRVERMARVGRTEWVGKTARVERSEWEERCGWAAVPVAKILRVKIGSAPGT
jgi:hypothetical protein